MTGAQENVFKRRLLAGERQYGLWMSLASPVAAEALSLIGYDWLMFDTEHAPVEIGALQPLLQAAAAGGSSCIARPAWNDKVLIKRILDVGAQTILVPFVQSSEEARAAVSAALYPPGGIRGVAGLTRASRYGTLPDYLNHANSETCVLVQIETGEALENLEAIAAVEGVDGVFIGPSDLAASLGHLGHPGAEEVQTVLRKACGRIDAAHKASGILATTPEDAARYLDWGYRFVALSVDLGLLVSAARGVLNSARRDSKIK